MIAAANLSRLNLVMAVILDPRPLRGGELKRGVVMVISPRACIDVAALFGMGLALISGPRWSSLDSYSNRQLNQST